MTSNDCQEMWRKPISLLVVRKLMRIGRSLDIQCAGPGEVEGPRWSQGLEVRIHRIELTNSIQRS